MASELGNKMENKMGSGSPSAGSGSEFVGVWNMESSHNYDDYMKAVGSGTIMSKVGTMDKPRMTITVENDQWTMKMDSTLKSHMVQFRMGEEIDETGSEFTGDDRKVKTKFVMEGNKLIEEQRGEVPSQIIREVTGNKMIVTCKAKDVVATREYSKDSKDH